MSTKSDLQGAANVDVFMGLLESNGLNLSVEQDLELTRQMSGRNFPSRRRQVVKSMERSGIIANDGSVNAAIASNQDRVDQWFTALMAILDPSSVPPPPEEPIAIPTPAPEPDNSGFGSQFRALPIVGALVTFASEIGHNYLYDQIKNLIAGGDDERPDVVIEADPDNPDGARVVRPPRRPTTISSFIKSKILPLLFWGILAICILVFTSPLWIGLVPVVWLAYKWAKSWTTRNEVRWIGNELVPVLNETNIKWTDLNDRTKPAFVIVERTLTTRLRSRFKSESEINNVLVNLMRAINQHYGSVANAAVVMDRPDAVVPEEAYQIALNSDSRPSLIERIRERQNSL